MRFVGALGRGDGVTVTGRDDAPVLHSVTALNLMSYVVPSARPEIVIGLVRLDGERAVHTPLLSSQYS